MRSSLRSDCEVLFGDDDADVRHAVGYVDVPDPGRLGQRVVGADARAEPVVGVREARAHDDLARADVVLADAEGAAEERRGAGRVHVELRA